MPKGAPQIGVEADESGNYGRTARPNIERREG